MIRYTCKCGDSLDMPENSEASRYAKRTFKAHHDRKNPGHGWARKVIHGRKK